MLALLLVLAGGLAHAACNLLVKRAAVSGPAFVWLTTTGATALLLPVAIVVAMREPPSWATLAFAATGGRA